MRSLPLFLLAGCLAPYPVEPCAETATCRSAFGVGAVCGDDGFCKIAGPHPRCEQSWPEDLWARPEAYGDHVVLGAMFDLGPDLPNLKAATLAFAEASQAGLPNGVEVALVACAYGEESAADGLSLEEAVVETGTWLRDTLDVPAVIGPGNSATALIAYDALAPRDVLLIAPSATSPKLVTIDGETSTDAEPGLFWRPAPPDDAQAVAIAADLRSRGVREISVIYQDNLYGSELATLVEAAHTGPKTLLPYVDDNGRNSAVQAAVASGTTEEVVFIAADVQDVVAFLNSAAFIASYDDVRIFLTDAATDPFLFEETSAEAQAKLFPVIRGSRPATPAGPVYDSFVISYAAAYDGEDPTRDGFNAYAYDAGWMAMYGLAWATVQEDAIGGTNMARAMRRLAGPGAYVPVGPAGWSETTAAFAAGASVDLEGTSGDLDFDPVTGETVNSIEVWVPRDGAFVVVTLCQPDGACIGIE
ncbi:MAG: ABC-type branched-subunit amino acid transport system substrate-binding protein [Myxococcota bacterium]